MEVLMHYATPEQKERFLGPLVRGEVAQLLFDDRA